MPTYMPFSSSVDALRMLPLCMCTYTHTHNTNILARNAMIQGRVNVCVCAVPTHAGRAFYSFCTLKPLPRTAGKIRGQSCHSLSLSLSLSLSSPHTHRNSAPLTNLPRFSIFSNFIVLRPDFYISLLTEL